MNQTQAQRDIEKLRLAQQRLTPQRRLVLEVMQKSSGHVSVDDVMREVSVHDPDINIATVYRILGWLTEHEIICVTDMGDRDLSYEYLGNHRHHHLVCQQCGVQREVPFDLMSPVITELSNRYGFEARIDHQAIFGTCQACQEAAIS